jgi:hypothetical protein
VAQRRSWNLKRKAAYEELTRNGVLIEVVPRTWEDVEKSKSWWTSTWRKLLLDQWPTEIASASVPAASFEGERLSADVDLRLLASFPEIQRVIIRNSNRVTNDGLKSLSQLPQLRELTVHCMAQVDGEFLRHFGSANQLESLDLYLERFNVESLSQFASLRKLSISADSCSLNPSLEIQPFPSSVKELTLVFPEPLDAKMLRHWLDSCRLRSLQIRAMPREATASLERQVDLEELTIFDSPLVDEDLRFLEHCDRLKELSLEGMPIRGEFLSWIAASQQMESMAFDSTLMDDRHLVHLKRFQNLEGLELNWTPISGDGFAALGSFPRPCQLRLMGCQFSPAGKQAIAKCGGLGTDWNLDIDLPTNWTLDDLKYFEGRHDTVHLSMPIAAALKSLKTDSRYGRYYNFDRHSQHCDWFADPLDNCPKDLMAPVIRSREQALARLEEEDELEQEFWRIHAIHQQERAAKEARQ